MGDAGQEGGRPPEIVIDLGDRAIVLTETEDSSRSLWGRMRTALTPREVAELLPYLDSATRAIVEARRYVGNFVELDPTSVELIKQGLRGTVERGGWMQANLRDGNHYARVLRIRPATSLSTLAGGTAILGAIATQAQTAEMARDIKAIRQRVDQIHQHQQSEVVGTVNSVVAQVDFLVQRLRDEGRDSINDSEVSVTRGRFGEIQAQCWEHLQAAVASVDVARPRSARQMEKALPEGGLEKAGLYLVLLRQLHTAEVQFRLLEVALAYHDGNGRAAKDRMKKLGQLHEQLDADLQAPLARLNKLETSLRSAYTTERTPQEVLSSPGLPSFISAALAPGAKGSLPSIRIPKLNVQVPAPVVAGGVALSVTAAVKVNSVLETRAHARVTEQLEQLAERSSAFTVSVQQTQKHVESAQWLVGELTPAEG